MEGKLKLPMGIEDFEEIRTMGYYYADKTGLIRTLLDNLGKVNLFTRPRRFGKTLNMSMTECFFSNQYAGRSDLFEGLKVWEDEAMRRQQGMYPVIFMSFAGARAGAAGERKDRDTRDCVEAMKSAVKQILADVFTGFRDIMQSEIFGVHEREFFASVGDHMPDQTAQMAVRRLCGYLERYYGKKVIVLLDEYDAPMQEAWTNGYWEEAVAFFKNFFVRTFKDNDSMERGLITGITRISRESIFSGLNHLEVVTTTSDKYATSFGFTEEEVFKALDDAGLGEHKEGVKKWYDGFTFGEHRDIYNPWSIISFIGNNARYEAYWANTSSNDLVNTLIRTGSAEVKKTVEELLAGKVLRLPLMNRSCLTGWTAAQTPYGVCCWRRVI